MKQTSIQQSLDQSSNADPLYSLYAQEVEYRGHLYISKISMIPSITGGILPTDTISSLLLRLSINPSIFSYFQDENPISSLLTVISADMPEVVDNYILDFIDDITLNVKMKNPELHALRERTLIEQINIVCKGNDENQNKRIDHAIENIKECLVTIYYLRKIGYMNELSKYNPTQVEPIN